MSDADLMTEAFQLLERARAKAPLSIAAHAALEADLAEIAGRAEEPEEIHAVTAEQLEWLRPPGAA